MGGGGEGSLGALALPSLPSVLNGKFFSLSKTLKSRQNGLLKNTKAIVLKCGQQLRENTSSMQIELHLAKFSNK